jgi:hypothetical protein
MNNAGVIKVSKRHNNMFRIFTKHAQPQGQSGFRDAGHGRQGWSQSGFSTPPQLPKVHDEIVRRLDTDVWGLPRDIM